jgi:hypothetical protein
MSLSIPYTARTATQYLAYLTRGAFHQIFRDLLDTTRDHVGQQPVLGPQNVSQVFYQNLETVPSWRQAQASRSRLACATDAVLTAVASRTGHKVMLATLLQVVLKYHLLMLGITDRATTAVEVFVEQTLVQCADRMRAAITAAHAVLAPPTRETRGSHEWVTRVLDSHPDLVDDSIHDAVAFCVVPFHEHLDRLLAAAPQSQGGGGHGDPGHPVPQGGAGAPHNPVPSQLDRLDSMSVAPYVARDLVPSYRLLGTAAGTAQNGHLGPVAARLIEGVAKSDGAAGSSLPRVVETTYGTTHMHRLQESVRPASLQ